MFTLLRSATLSLLVLVAAARPEAAQCPIPDNLDGGPCCALTHEKLPAFPGFKQNVLDICWRNCNVDQVTGLVAKFTNQNILTPTGSDCGERLVKVELFDPASGAPLWTGQLRLVYSRTWLEGPPPPAGQRQVWRFLASGDLRPTTVGAMPCPVPPCAPAGNNRVRFTGYVDYARRCNVVPAAFEFAWMLTHACDFIDHAPGFPRAGAFHPDRSYTFVGPAAGFVPGPLQPLEGTPGSPFEAVRRNRFPPLGSTGPVLCEFEERAQHALLPSALLCACGAPTQQFLLGNLLVNGACGTTVTTPGGPFLPGFLSMGIGTWTVPGVYPGVEALRWNAGNYDEVDACTGVLRNSVFFGVTTLGGDPAVQVLTTGAGAPLPLTFIDQGTSIRLGGGPVMNCAVSHRLRAEPERVSPRPRAARTSRPLTAPPGRARGPGAGHGSGGSRRARGRPRAARASRRGTRAGTP